MFATIVFTDDSEQSSTMTIPLSSQDNLDAAELGDVADVLDLLGPLIEEMDDATDASVEKATLHIVFSDATNDTDILKGGFATVEDKARLFFQTDLGGTWSTELPAPDQPFLAGDIVDESDSDWASLIAAILAAYSKPGLEGLLLTGSFLVEYLGGYRTRKKTRKRKPGVTQAHDASGV
jgi:hypothetical protein